MSPRTSTSSPNSAIACLVEGGGRVGGKEGERERWYERARVRRVEITVESSIKCAKPARGRCAVRVAREGAKGRGAFKAEKGEGKGRSARWHLINAKPDEYLPQHASLFSVSLPCGLASWPRKVWSSCCVASPWSSKRTIVLRRSRLVDFAASIKAQIKPQNPRNLAAVLLALSVLVPV